MPANERRLSPFACVWPTKRWIASAPKSASLIGRSAPPLTAAVAADTHLRRLRMPVGRGCCCMLLLLMLLLLPLLLARLN